jgi:hypothetical protein
MLLVLNVEGLLERGQDGKSFMLSENTGTQALGIADDGRWNRVFSNQALPLRAGVGFTHIRRLSD